VMSRFLPPPATKFDSVWDPYRLSKLAAEAIAAGTHDPATAKDPNERDRLGLKCEFAESGFGVSQRISWSPTADSSKLSFLRTKFGVPAFENSATIPLVTFQTGWTINPNIEPTLPKNLITKLFDGAFLPLSSPNSIDIAGQAGPPLGEVSAAKQPPPKPQPVIPTLRESGQRLVQAQKQSYFLQASTTSKPEREEAARQLCTQIQSALDTQLAANGRTWIIERTAGSNNRVRITAKIRPSGWNDSPTAEETSAIKKILQASNLIVLSGPTNENRFEWEIVLQQSLMDQYADQIETATLALLSQQTIDRYPEFYRLALAENLIDPKVDPSSITLQQLIGDFSVEPKSSPIADVKTLESRVLGLLKLQSLDSAIIARSVDENGNLLLTFNSEPSEVVNGDRCASAARDVARLLTAHGVQGRIGRNHIRIFAKTADGHPQALIGAFTCRFTIPGYRHPFGGEKAHLSNIVQSIFRQAQADLGLIEMNVQTVTANPNLASARTTRRLSEDEKRSVWVRETVAKPLKKSTQDTAEHLRAFKAFIAINLGSIRDPANELEIVLKKREIDGAVRLVIGVKPNLLTAEQDRIDQQLFHLLNDCQLSFIHWGVGQFDLPMNEIVDTGVGHRVDGWTQSFEAGLQRLIESPKTGAIVRAGLQIGQAVTGALCTDLFGIDACSHSQTKNLDARIKRIFQTLANERQLEGVCGYDVRKNIAGLPVLELKIRKLAGETVFAQGEQTRKAISALRRLGIQGLTTDVGANADTIMIPLIDEEGGYFSAENYAQIDPQGNASNVSEFLVHSQEAAENARTGLVAHWKQLVDVVRPDQQVTLQLDLHAIIRRDLIQFVADALRVSPAAASREIAIDLQQVNDDSINATVTVSSTMPTARRVTLLAAFRQEGIPFSEESGSPHQYQLALLGTPRHPELESLTSSMAFARSTEKPKSFEELMRSGAQRAEDPFPKNRRSNDSTFTRVAAMPPIARFIDRDEVVAVEPTSVAQPTATSLAVFSVKRPDLDPQSALSSWVNELILHGFQNLNRNRKQYSFLWIDYALPPLPPPNISRSMRNGWLVIESSAPPKKSKGLLRIFDEEPLDMVYTKRLLDVNGITYRFNEESGEIFLLQANDGLEPIQDEIVRLERLLEENKLQLASFKIQPTPLTPKQEIKQASMVQFGINLTARKTKSNLAETLKEKISELETALMAYRMRLTRIKEFNESSLLRLSSLEISSLKTPEDWDEESRSQGLPTSMTSKMGLQYSRARTPGERF